MDGEIKYPIEGVGYGGLGKPYNPEPQLSTLNPRPRPIEPLS